jgi:hypothetical protein
MDDRESGSVDEVGAREIERRYEPVLTLFFAGRLPRFNHARHLAVANILLRLPHGRELMHLGLRITTLREGVPERYSREVTDYYWERLDGRLPDLSEFADVPGLEAAGAPATDPTRCGRE